MKVSEWKHSDRDGDAESRWDGFVLFFSLAAATAAVRLTKTDVSPEMKHLQARRDELQLLCVRSVLPSSSVSLSLSLLYLLASPLHPSHYHHLLPSLSLSLSLELIDYVSSIHLSLCRLATGALSGVEGGSLTEGRGG